MTDQDRKDALEWVLKYPFYDCDGYSVPDNITETMRRALTAPVDAPADLVEALKQAKYQIKVMAIDCDNEATELTLELIEEALAKYKASKVQNDSMIDYALSKGLRVVEKSGEVMLSAAPVPPVDAWNFNMDEAPKTRNIVILSKWGNATTVKWSDNLGGSWQVVDDEGVHINPRFIIAFIEIPSMPAPPRNSGE